MKIEKYLLAATERPFFLGDDEAEDAPAHTNSGLALIDTGRTADFTIARLMEWNNAQLFVALANSADALVALVNAINAYAEAKKELTASFGEILQDGSIAKKIVQSRIDAKFSAVISALAALAKHEAWKEWG